MRWRWLAPDIVEAILDGREKATTLAVLSFGQRRCQRGRTGKFKTRLRAHAFGWRGTDLAISRLKEAVSEIKLVTKTDPMSAGEGVVSLVERVWPEFQDIDTSSGWGQLLITRWTS